MAKYVAGAGSFYAEKRLYRPGEEVVLPDDKKPPPHLIPVDDAAKAAYAKAYAVQSPQAKPVAKVEPEKPLSMFEVQQEINKSDKQYAKKQ